MFAVCDASGMVVRQVMCPDDQAAQQCKTGETIATIAAPLDPAQSWKMVSGKITAIPKVTPVETDAQALLRMLATVDKECETLSSAFLTTGGAKKREYARKAQEAYDYSTLSISAIAALLLPANLASTQAHFPWAYAEMQDTGDSFATVIGRYQQGLASSALTIKLAARSQKLKRAMRAAATPAAAKAIFDARSWPTS